MPISPYESCLHLKLMLSTTTRPSAHLRRPSIRTVAHRLLTWRLQGVRWGVPLPIAFVHLHLHLRLHACAHPAQQQGLSRACADLRAFTAAMLCGHSLTCMRGAARAAVQQHMY